MSTKGQRINEQIRAREILLIDENNVRVGIMSAREALDLANQRGMDLVEVAPNAIPPVCRLLDFGKFQYEKAKKEREARKAQKQIDIKEVRLKPKTADHDLAFKIRDIRRLLGEGDKVKVRVRFRAREITHPEIARDQLLRIAEEVADVATVEQRPLLEGKSLLMVLSPIGAKPGVPATAQPTASVNA